MTLFIKKTGILVNIGEPSLHKRQNVFNNRKTKQRNT